MLKNEMMKDEKRSIINIELSNLFIYTMTSSITCISNNLLSLIFLLTNDMLYLGLNALIKGGSMKTRRKHAVPGKSPRANQSR